jgi:hypothetical protein
MRNAIQFLELAGSKPFTAAEYAAAVAALEVRDEEKQALFDQDHASLSDLLGGRAKMYCFVVAPEEEEAPAAPEAPDEVPQEQEPNE